MKKITAIIERGTDGRFSICMGDEADALDYSCIGTGDTEEEARKDFLAVYEDMRNYYREEGKYFEEVEFEFVTDYISMLQYLSGVFTLVGLSKITGINKGQLSHYITATSRPGRRTIERIRQSLHNFGMQLASQTA